MAYEQRDNSGSLFKNDKQGNEARPDYKGKAMVNGAMVEVSAWIRTAESGKKYMSLVFQEPYQQQDNQRNKPAPDKTGQWKAGAPAAPKSAPRQQVQDFEDDSVPF